MRDDEAVVGDDRRKENALVFGDSKGEKDRVGHVLVGLAVKMEPGGVAQRQGVALVHPDVPGRAERAIHGRP